jgi:AraC-like DNA-binding protein
MGWSRRWRYRGLYLTLPAIQEVAKGLGIEAVPYFTQNMLGDVDLIDAFLTLHRALEDGRDAMRERELLVGSFGRLFRRHGSDGSRIAPPPGGREPLAKAIEIMRARYAEELGLGEMAAAAGLTIFQLIGLCKRMTGLTPHAYLTQMRLYAACRHLRLGLPISEAALLAGFYDQSALTKHFKRHYGITPRQFASAARKR